ncbi:MAG: hypothetical protein U1F76_17990 [Candidatus Competibacteraceae bacterium]
MRDAAALEGIRFETPYARAGNTAGGAYSFEDENWRSGCRVTLESSSGRTITFSATNCQCRHLGVYIRFLDNQGAPLPLASLPAGERAAAHRLDTATAGFLGIVGPQPLFFGVPLSGDVAARFTVTLPSAAMSLEVLAGGIGLGPLPDRLAADGAVQIPGAVSTLVMEWVLPAFYLAAGKTVDRIQAAQPTVLAPLEAYVLDFAARPEIQSTFLTAIGKAALDAVDTTSDNDKLELLRLPTKPYPQTEAAAYAIQVAGQGKNLGRLQGARAIALAGNVLLVLEDDNERIQAFDLAGNVVKYFNDSASMPLKQWPDDATRRLSYLDLQVDGAGYLYVLSYEEPGDHSDQYRLDVYTPQGSPLARTTGVATARFVLDPWGAVYTLDYELLQGPNQRPEPSVSLWAAAGPAPGSEGI